MRRPLIFLTICFMTGAQLGFAGSALAGPGELWTITGDNVNLRRGPGTQHEVKRQLKRRQEVIERAQQGEWRQVEVVGGDVLGWVHGSLLTDGATDAIQATDLPAPAGVPAGVPTAEPTGEPTPTAATAKAPDPRPKGPLDVRKAFQDRTPLPPGAAIETAGPDDVLEQMRGYVQRRDKLPKDPAAPRVGHSGREIVSPVPIRNPGDQSRVPTELVLASSPKVSDIDVDAMEHFRESVSYLNSRAWSVAGIKLFSEIEPVGGGVVQVKTTKDWFDVPEIGQTSYLNTLVDRWSSAKADGAPAGVMLVDPTGDLLMHQTKP